MLKESAGVEAVEKKSSQHAQGWGVSGAFSQLEATWSQRTQSGRGSVHL